MNDTTIPLKNVSIGHQPTKPYIEIRESLRTGDILLCAGQGWRSKLIQKATRSPYSHVGLVVRMLTMHIPTCPD